MKKIFLSLVLFFPINLTALPSGNPSEANLIFQGLFWKGNQENCNPCGEPCTMPTKWWGLSCLAPSLCHGYSLRVGFYGDYVFNRHLKVAREHFHPAIEKFYLFTNAGYIALNLWDRLDLFGTVGITEMGFKTNISAFAPLVVFTPGQVLEVANRSHLSWSVGMHATLWQWCGTNVGVEWQYFQTKPPLSKMIVSSGVGAGATVYPTNRYTFYREWQLGLGLSKKIDLFLPYLALTVSQAKWRDPVRSFLLTPSFALDNLKSQRTLGCAMGVTLLIHSHSTLTFEGRLGSESALYLNGQVRL